MLFRFKVITKQGIRERTQLADTETCLVCINMTMVDPGQLERRIAMCKRAPRKCGFIVCSVPFNSSSGSSPCFREPGTLPASGLDAPGFSAPHGLPNVNRNHTILPALHLHQFLPIHLTTDQNLKYPSADSSNSPNADSTKSSYSVAQMLLHESKITSSDVHEKKKEEADLHR